jgi:hypothetical protein
VIDPLDPTVRAWLQRELPRLVHAGTINVAQADLIARRYGVTVTAADIAAATVPDTSPQATSNQVDAPAVPGSEADPVIGVIGAGVAESGAGVGTGAEAGVGQRAAASGQVPSMPGGASTNFAQETSRRQPSPFRNMRHTFMWSLTITTSPHAESIDSMPT